MSIAPTAAEPALELEPLALITNASGPVALVLWLLVGASIAVWVIVVLKALQLRRWRRTGAAFDRALSQAARGAPALLAACDAHRDALGADVLRTMLGGPADEKSLTTAADEAILGVVDRVESMMSTLSSIGAASPFIGLFGTVYGIMDAFLRIGREKSVTLPVVAPAIGEALIATAIGLFAAIPAVIAYNALSKRTDSVISRLQARARRWAAHIELTRAVDEVGA